MKKLLVATLFTSMLLADNFIDPNPPVRADSMIPAGEPASVKLEPIAPIFAEPKEPDQSKNGGIMTVKSVEFWVQMGAFEHIAGAKIQENKLRAEGLNARIFSSDLHRVAVGPYKSRDSAAKSMQMLKQIEKEAFLTTPENLRR